MSESRSHENCFRAKTPHGIHRWSVIWCSDLRFPTCRRVVPGRVLNRRCSYICSDSPGEDRGRDDRATAAAAVPDGARPVGAAAAIVEDDDGGRV